MTPPRHVLVVRFSALGDVAMTVPVIKLLLLQHSTLQITYVSIAFVQPLFKGIERLNFYAADLQGKHKGVKGLYELHKELKSQYQFDSIADLHNVLRTKTLRFFFSLSGKQIAVIDKGRKEKVELTRKKDKILRPLKSTFERYAAVFTGLNLPVYLTTTKAVVKNASHSQALADLKEQGYKLIGVAPFARHAEKMYPVEKMKEVMQLLLKGEKIKLFLFAGKTEAVITDTLAKELEHTISLADKMDFGEELQYIEQLDVMISMDSANMHLASLFSIPVVSIWGSTHTFAGFYGWGQASGNAVQVDLYCRPCSVFGNRTCYRGDLACLHSIDPIVIYNRVMQQLYKEADI